MSKFWKALENKGRISTLLGLILFIDTTIKLNLDFYHGNISWEFIKFIWLYVLCIIFIILPSKIEVTGSKISIKIED